MGWSEDKEGKSKMIFVFGSNLKGIHGAGAALYAKQHYGALNGRGVGLQGNSYAIPTKRTPWNTLPLDEIEEYVKEFLLFAQQHPSYTFKVTRIGCGLAGYSNEQIAPLFKDAPSNCYFDPEWLSFGLKSWDNE